MDVVMSLGSQPMGSVDGDGESSWATVIPDLLDDTSTAQWDPDSFTNLEPDNVSPVPSHHTHVYQRGHNIHSPGVERSVNNVSTQEGDSEFSGVAPPGHLISASAYRLHRANLRGNIEHYDRTVWYLYCMATDLEHALNNLEAVERVAVEGFDGNGTRETPAGSYHQGNEYLTNLVALGPPPPMPQSFTHNVDTPFQFRPLNM